VSLFAAAAGRSPEPGRVAGCCASASTGTKASKPDRASHVGAGDLDFRPIVNSHGVPADGTFHWQKARSSGWKSSKLTLGIGFTSNDGVNRPRELVSCEF
jgi:hypothetical protein